MRILLVVEDDADLAQFLRKGLREERYAVDVAVDGEQGSTSVPSIPMTYSSSTSCCRRLMDDALPSFCVTPGVTALGCSPSLRDTTQDKVSGLDLGPTIT